MTNDGPTPTTVPAAATPRDQHSTPTTATDEELFVIEKEGRARGLWQSILAGNTLAAGRRAIYDHGTNDGFTIAQFGFLAQQTEAAREIAEDHDRQNRDDFRMTAGHADGTGPDTQPLNLPGLPLPEKSAAAVCAAQTMQALDDAVYFGHATWFDFLLAQTFAISQEKDQTHLRTNLIELAATAQRWAESIDERTTALAEDQAARTAELPAMGGILADPDCIAGKHGNCSGKGLDVGTDQPAPCPCRCHASAK
ncbi:hypothetical protein EOG37_01290 [Clavibacter michiganensis subsp. michiganensis]|uniref:hypothetical protein n=1 Tax=Clavibacter michiganensis TaxID=28447 RepID=UPI001C64CC1A|nr:hypothetical protein [Clavibacter michiganensis]MBW8025314.1 hypothetical protein [Clavibacter michiganensis subsp. michiganensis]